MHLTCAVAAAMCRAVECAAGLRPGIKWTNDLVWGKQKFAGILTEMGLNAAGGVDWAIVGIGVNCCQKTEDFPRRFGTKPAPSPWRQVGKLTAAGSPPP